MTTKKFSEFTEETSSTDMEVVVGLNTSGENAKISASSLGGVTEFDQLTDVALKQPSRVLLTNNDGSIVVQGTPQELFQGGYMGARGPSLVYEVRQEVDNSRLQTFNMGSSLDAQGLASISVENVGGFDTTLIDVPDAPVDGCEYTRKDGTWNRSFKESINGFVLDVSLAPAARTLALAGTPDPSVSVNMVYIPFANLQLSVQTGTALQLNAANGTLDVLEDLLAIQSSAFARTAFSGADNVVLGIGIGDPTDLPTLPGTSTVGGTFVSSFVEARRGEGNNRQVTFQLPYFPVGKTGSNPALTGDQIFLVAWTEETDAASVRFDSLIAPFRVFN